MRVSELASVFNTRHIAWQWQALVKQCNAVVETLASSQRAGLKASHTALDSLDLERLGLRLSALSGTLFAPAELMHLQVNWVYQALSNSNVI